MSKPASVCLGTLKRLKKSPITIGTHSGVFHCDELLGTYMLQLLLPDSVVVRSRENDQLKNCDIVIDVGNVYDPKKYLFDHHQRGFEESMSTILPNKPWKTKLSSAGLVYCHFGIDVIKRVVGETDDVKVEAVYDHIYENFIQEIDAIDNGYPMFDGEPRYRITTSLSSRVNRMNPQWNTKNEKLSEDDLFFEAQKYVGEEFEDRVKFAAEVWWPARKIVLNAINDRYKVDDCGLIMELSEACPWKEHFFNLEEELKVENPILFAIFHDGKDSWRVQAVSVNAGSYICRLFLHSAWFGLRDEELSKTANIDGCMFVHHTGFIGGNKTKEGALQMALKTIELNQSSLKSKK